MEVTYHKEGEYYLPDLMVPEARRLGGMECCGGDSFGRTGTARTPQCC